MSKVKRIKLESSQKRVYNQICKLWLRGKTCYALFGNSKLEVMELVKVQFGDSVQPESFIVLVKSGKSHSIERVNCIEFAL